MEYSVLKENERLDDLQLNNLFIIQSKEMYCFTSDAVLLSDFCKIKKNEIVFDFGTGSGIIAVLLAVKTEAKFIYGIEVQPDLCDMAKRSVNLNLLSEKIEILNLDIKDLYKALNQQADVIVCNPPYFKSSDDLKNKNLNIAIARHEHSINLNEICLAAKRQLKFKGRFYIIYPADRLIELINALTDNNLQAKKLQLVQANSKTPPHLVLVESVLGGKSGVKILNNLIIKEDK